MESYSIMDYGLYNRNSYAPSPYTAWEQSVMQWITPEDLSGKMADGSYHISDVAPLIEGGKAYKVVNPDNDRDYIIMENVLSDDENNPETIPPIDYGFLVVSL